MGGDLCLLIVCQDGLCADFDGTLYTATDPNSQYLTFRRGKRLRVLRPPPGARPEGWAYGQVYREERGSQESWWPHRGGRFTSEVSSGIPEHNCEVHEPHDDVNDVVGNAQRICSDMHTPGDTPGTAARLFFLFCCFLDQITLGQW